MTANEKLAKNLSRILQEKQISAEELAKMTGYTLKFIKKILNAESKLIRASVIRTICLALNIFAIDLIEI